MYVIRERKSKAILHMRQSVPGDNLKPEEIFPNFDDKTMEFGRSPTHSVPAWFTIENGVIKPSEPPAPEVKGEATAAPAQSLDQLKESSIAELSRLSFELRKKIIPDHEFQNAALGIYDEKRTRAIRDTTKAFRDEYHRLEAAVRKAKTVKELQALKANFPTKVEAAMTSPSRKGDSTKEKD